MRLRTCRKRSESWTPTDEPGRLGRMAALEQDPELGAADRRFDGRRSTPRRHEDRARRALGDLGADAPEEQAADPAASPP